MKAVEEVLAAWREAERLLEELPPVGRDHESVGLAVAALHEAYDRLTSDPIPTTPDVLARTHSTIDSSRELLRLVRASYRLRTQSPGSLVPPTGTAYRGVLGELGAPAA